MAAVTRTGVSSPSRGELVGSDTLSGLAAELISAGQGLQVTGVLRGQNQLSKATTRVDCVAAADAQQGESVTGLLVGQRIRISVTGVATGNIAAGTLYYLDAAVPGEWNSTVNAGTGIRLLGLSGGRGQLTY